MHVIRYRLHHDEQQTYRRYASLALPRHTSYPIAPAWSAIYGPADFADDLTRSARQRRLLSLYVHVPFCERLCYYCACTKEIVPPARRASDDPAVVWLAGIDKETARVAERTGPGDVRQVHLGGGTPTFLSAPQLQQLCTLLAERFNIARNAERAIEVDPRTASREQLAVLREHGFNRISLGIQDFNPQVQQAVNRVQPFDMVERCLNWARALGYTSINFDLIYGLPFQTPDTMADTIRRTLTLKPDRIAFYRLAVIPDMFRWQRVFRAEDLPGSDDLLSMNLAAINQFLDAGYEFIGLDHFARPDESLAQALHDGSLRRSFQGMTTGHGYDVLALGPSAISQLDDAFAQNRKTNAEWRQALDSDFATERGLRLTADDRLRREVMRQLYGFGSIDTHSLEMRFGIPFDAYFAAELRRLKVLIDDGLVHDTGHDIRLTTPLGRLLVRVVAAVFDRYLPPDAFREGLPEAQASRVG